MATPSQKMVDEQLRPHGVTDERVLQAMGAVPRDEFLPPRLRRLAYEDRALAIDCGQTISQPLVVALMTQAVAPEPHEVALEVGAGSGYQAAVLSRLCRQVVTVELEPALAERALQALSRIGVTNVQVAVADGSLGWPASAPYDIVLVACATREVPAALVEQLAEGGRMVIPLEVSEGGPQDLRLYVKRGGEVTFRSLFPVVFVPLRPGAPRA